MCVWGGGAICVRVEVIVSEYEVEGARKMGFQDITWRTLYVSHWPSTKRGWLLWQQDKEQALPWEWTPCIQASLGQVRPQVQTDGLGLTHESLLLGRADHSRTDLEGLWEE